MSKTYLIVHAGSAPIRDELRDWTKNLIGDKSHAVYFGPNYVWSLFFRDDNITVTTQMKPEQSAEVLARYDFLRSKSHADRPKVVICHKDRVDNITGLLGNYEAKSPSEVELIGDEFSIKTREVQTAKNARMQRADQRFDTILRKLVLKEMSYDTPEYSKR